LILCKFTNLLLNASSVLLLSCKHPRFWVRFSVSGTTCPEPFFQGTGQNKVYPIPIKVRCQKKRASVIRNWGEIREIPQKETRLGSRIKFWDIKADSRILSCIHLIFLLFTIFAFLLISLPISSF
jgi:hypothetical protein